MGMVVRTNTMALNAYRQLGMNNSAVSKSLEKLSSGFRINRAGDDAAGLAISEKMKAQITGLETASANAQDGISLIQTAEGNLTEVHSMLNRMVELATKSANGTYTVTERRALQDEVDSLLDEIDRISKSANFNGTNLLDGSLAKINGDAFATQTIEAEDGASIDLTAGLPSENQVGDIADGGPIHLSKPGQAQQGGQFSIDLADYELDLTNATGNVTVTWSAAGRGAQFETTIDTTVAGNKKVWSGEDIAEAFLNDTSIWVDPTGTLADGTTKKCPADGTYAALSHALYKVEQSGTKLTFTYAGATANGENATVDDPITEAMTAIDKNPDKSITITAAGTGLNQAGSSYHGVLDIKETKMAVEGQRAGIEVDLSKVANLFKEGSQLTIDGKTFTFKMNADSTLTGENVIDLSGVKGAGDTPTAAEYAKAAAMQLSNKSTDHFEISDGGSGIIKVDQTVEDYNSGANAPYTTYESLTGLFSASLADTKAGTELTITDSKIKEGDVLNIGGKTYKFVDQASATDDAPKNMTEVVMGKNGADAIDNLVTALQNNRADVTKNGTTLTINGATITDGGLTLQIGDTADPFNKMNVAVKDMSARGLDLADLRSTGIMTERDSSDAIQRIKDAINTVSSTRAGMGALQNRLEHTINNLDVAVENLSSANSRIRDTDMAKEMMNYTKMNVLVQSAQAMLAQANQQPQSVLQLLQ